MDLLPSSVESYLQEAGFSGTEIFVLKRLMEDDAMSLREMAIKTGKSTGVLDQAVKKLLKKGIVDRIDVNGHHKYGLHSLTAVREWMEEDMQHKQDMLLRKQRNFDAFISSLAKDKERPEMEHFDGIEGIKQAYMALLSKDTKEFLMYVPVTCKEEDDELRDFRVQYFRERRRRGIFSRVLAHTTPLGHRYQNRDPFEYRKTILLPEDEYPFTFEQIIAGDTIACFNHPEHKVCFIHYPHLVQSQRLLFESLWRTGERGAKIVAIKTDMAIPVSTNIPLQTRAFSNVRNFFLSPHSIFIFLIFICISAIATFALYKSNQSVNFQRMQDKVTAIARTGALQMDINDLQQLNKKNDYLKPQWQKVVNQLIDIRTKNTDIMYVYIFRKSKEDPNGLEFIADSHSLNPFANTDNDSTNDIDMNGDGKVDGSPTGGDYQSWPGQQYPTPPSAAFDSFNGLSASKSFYEDQFGKVVTGYAPVFNEKGNIIAMFAVDIQSTKLDELTAHSFVPLLVFLIIFISFVVVRIIANGWFFRGLIR